MQIFSTVLTDFFLLSDDKPPGRTGDVSLHSPERGLHGRHRQHQQAGRWIRRERRGPPGVGDHESPEMRMSPEDEIFVLRSWQ